MRLLLAAVLTLALAAPAAADQIDVVGGGETQREWPFMVYLETGRQEIDLIDAQYCGGSLIAPKWVLTAAHCMLTLNVVEPLILTVVQGRHDRTETTGERVQAVRVLQNPDWGSETGNSHDVMLVELSRPIDVPTVKLTAPSEAGLWAPGAVATILGWGATSEGGESSDVLKEAQVPIVSDEQCAADYAESGGFHAPTMVCAGYREGGTDTCQGDSGGPLLVGDGLGGFRLVGVTSWGEGCARPNFPGVYSEAAGDVLRSWIASHVPEAVAAPASAVAPPPPPPAPPPPPPPPPASSSSEPAAERPARRKRSRRGCASKRTRKARRACKKRRAAARRRAAERRRDR